MIGSGCYVVKPSPFPNVSEMRSLKIAIIDIYPVFQSYNRAIIMIIELTKRQLTLCYLPQKIARFF